MSFWWDPVLIGRLLDYVVQGSRFEVDAGFGCINSSSGSILTVLLVQSWGILPPLVSVIIYYRAFSKYLPYQPLYIRLIAARVAWIFYRQHRDLNRFLRSNNSVTRTNYMRIFILTSIDILLTLPIGIAAMVLFISTLAQEGKLQFYEGWSAVHADNGPISVPYPSSASERAQTYFEHWSSLALAIAIFGLFGLTREARDSYWRIICAVRNLLARKAKQYEQEGDGTDTTLESEMEFGTQNEIISFDAERGCVHSSSLLCMYWPVTEPLRIAGVLDSSVSAHDSHWERTLRVRTNKMKQSKIQPSRRVRAMLKATPGMFASAPWQASCLMKIV